MEHSSPQEQRNNAHDYIIRSPGVFRTNSCSGELALVAKLNERINNQNATDMLQVVNFTDSLQHQFHQVATCLLKSGLLQLVICRLVTTCMLKQLAASLLTTCNRFVLNKLSQTVRTPFDINLL